MLTIAALMTLGLGAWGAIEVVVDLRDDHRAGRRATVRTRIGDVAWLCASVAIVITALHSLTALWVRLF